MKVRILFVVLGAFLLAGCATTQQKVAPINQVQNQVVDLQQRMEDQEKEIVDLKYEVKDLTGKLAAKDPVIVETSAPYSPAYKTTASSSGNDTDGVIKVAVAPAEIQKALRAAGVYEGKIDGKIGSKTKSAIIDFQKKHGLKADGVVGQKTWVEMKAYLN